MKIFHFAFSLSTIFAEDLREGNKTRVETRVIHGFQDFFAEYC